MGITIELFPLGTVYRADLDKDLTQDICDTVDTSRYTSGVVSGTALSIHDTGSMYVEGSDDGQQFFEILSLSTGARTQERHLNKTEQPGSSNRLYRYLRWRMDTAAASNGFCGRITVTLK